MNINPCHKCGSDAIKMFSFSEYRFRKCMACGLCGIVSKSVEGSAIEWNDQQNIYSVYNLARSYLLDQDCDLVDENLLEIFDIEAV